MPLSPIPIFIGTTLAVIGSGYVFKKFIYDPHLAPIFEALVAAAQGYAPQRLPETHQSHRQRGQRGRDQQHRHHHHLNPIPVSTGSSTASRYHQTNTRRRRSMVEGRQPHRESELILAENENENENEPRNIDQWGRPSKHLGERYTVRDDIYSPASPARDSVDPYSHIPKSRHIDNYNAHNLAPVYRLPIAEPLNRDREELINVPVRSTSPIAREHDDLRDIVFNTEAPCLARDDLDRTPADAQNESERHWALERRSSLDYSVDLPSLPDWVGSDLPALHQETLQVSSLMIHDSAELAVEQDQEQDEWANVIPPFDFGHFRPGGISRQSEADVDDMVSLASFSTYADGEDCSTASETRLPAVDIPWVHPASEAVSSVSSLDDLFDARVPHGPLGGDSRDGSLIYSVETSSDDELGSDWDAVSQI